MKKLSDMEFDKGQKIAVRVIDHGDGSTWDNDLYEHYKSHMQGKAVEMEVMSYNNHIASFELNYKGMDDDWTWFLPINGEFPKDKIEVKLANPLKEIIRKVKNERN